MVAYEIFTSITASTATIMVKADVSESGVETAASITCLTAMSLSRVDL